MIEFFIFFGILFFILLGSNLYYHFLEKAQKSKGEKTEKIIKASTPSKSINIFVLIFLILILILIALLMSYAFINLFTQDIFIIYMGTIAFIMMSAFFLFIFKGPYRFYIAILLASITILLQINLKLTLLGGIILAFGYIGIVNYIVYKKIISAKFILFLLIAFIIYDFATVFLSFLQVTLMTKTTNNIFPAALVFGKTSLGIGDVFFTLLMTSFSRYYYGLKPAVLTAFLVSLPLIGLGIFVALFPKQNIGLPYLVLSTPIFLAIVVIMKLRGKKLA